MQGCCSDAEAAEVWNLDGKYASFAEVEGKAATASNDYPEKAEDLSRRLAGMRRGGQETHAQLAKAEEELSRLGTPQVDLARLGVAVMASATGANALSTSSGALTARIAELYRSYS